MKHLILESIKPFSALFISLILCAGEVWGVDVTISVTFNATYKPQNGVSLIDGDETYGTVSCNSASSNRAIIRNTSSLTISATKEGWTLKSVGLTWRGSNDPANTSVLTITGGTFNSLTSITPSSSTVVIGSESTNNNYQISAITVVFTEGSTCSAAQPGTINKGTVSGGVITLTADGDPGTGEDWYWQSTADGTATTESGATKNVNTAGTYYIRSYKASETCWSAATSVTVEEEDFYTPCETPHISVDPNSAEATYNRGDAATALSVTASVGDGGTLSYQWYSNTTATNSGGTLISGATSADYTPSTAVAGTLYYYCVVTNTLAGHSPVSATSNVSGAIIVNSSCPAPNSGVVLYKFEVNSSVSDGNICSSGNNPVQLTEPTQLSTLIGGTLDGWISSGTSWNNLAFNGGRITYANNDKGVLIITLDCPIEEGDLIRFNNYSSSNSKYNYLRHTSYSTSDDQLTLPASKSATEIQSLVAPAAFAGKTELFIVPGARTTGISYFEIIRSCPVLLDANTNGGKVGGENTKTLRGAIGDELALLHAFKDGYRFKGWFDAPSGGVAVSNPYTITGPTTLYAQFEDCPDNGLLYKFEVGTGLTNGSVTANGVDFDFNTANYLSSIIGGTLTTGGSAASKVTITGNNAITITDNAAYLKVDLDCALEEGDVFQSTVSGNTVYVSKATSRTKTAELAIGTMVQTPIPATLAGEKTLYIWKGSGSNDALTYFEITRPRRTAITLDATGAYNNYTTSVTAVLYNEMPEIHTLPMRVGYVFGGYYDEPNGAGTQYYNGLGVGMRNWDKDVATATLYAHWVAPCDMAPSLTNTVPVVTIWDRQEVDMSLVRLTCDYDTTGIHYSLLSSSEAILGCTYAYEDERIYIKGTPALGNTSTVTKTITFTMTNDCSPAHTYTVDATIRIYPAGQRAKIAYIITGTKGGGFDDYSTADESASSDLLTYLRTFYTVDCVNGYATQDATAMENFYKDYDLLIITDFLDTNEGYTNALGTLIDKKPILSFEAYGAKLSNWHIGSNPTEPDPKVKKMKILCAGHAIFKNAKYLPGDATETQVVIPADTTVNVLSTISGEGLQGFVINEAPDFIFLATVRDENNKRDLIVCCERQIVFPARLLLYGINYNEMGNLTQAGQIVMRQMIDYLLMTDETKVADCSLVFDDNNGTHVWSDPKNWFPGYNIVPTPYHPTRIIAECHVDIDYAHAGSVKVNKGKDALGNPVDGILIVEPYGGLTVAGMVAKVNDTRYASPTTIKAEDLLIKATDTGNGSFVYGNKESDVRATVEYYSRGENATSANPVWQYIGIPFQAAKTAMSLYYAAWMCRWSSASDGALGGLWQWVDNNDVLVPFEGYCITQTAKKTYTFTGKLNAPVTTTVELDNRDADGYAFAANSWTAPIKIQEMQDDDFTNAEKSIYIYHSGTYANWTDNGDPVSAKDGAVATLPGQYAVVPIHSSPYLAGADSVIPAMQGFFVKAIDPSAEAEVKLAYNRVVYDAKYFKTSTQPMRAPNRAMEQSDAPEVMILTVAGDSLGADRIHILSRGDFSQSYEDGWDGRKIEGDAVAPKLAVVKDCGEMAVAAVSDFEEREMIFRAGEDSAYTFHFDYNGETIYLYDRLTEQATEIATGNTYAFVAKNKTPMPRFLITSNPPSMPMCVEQLDNGQWTIDNARKMIIDGQLYILRDNRFYDARGVRVTDQRRKEAAQ